MNEFHISRFSRDSYGLESLHFESLTHARQAAEQIGVSAADLYALGLIDEVLRLVIRQFDVEHSGLIARAASFLDENLGAEPVTSTQLTFTREFPPELSVQREAHARRIFEGCFWLCHFGRIIPDVFT